MRNKYFMWTTWSWLELVGAGFPTHDRHCLVGAAAGSGSSNDQPGTTAWQTWGGGNNHHLCHGIRATCCLLCMGPKRRMEGGGRLRHRKVSPTLARIEEEASWPWRSGCSLMSPLLWHGQISATLPYCLGMWEEPVIAPREILLTSKRCCKYLLGGGKSYNNFNCLIHEALLY